MKRIVIGLILILLISGCEGDFNQKDNQCPNGEVLVEEKCIQQVFSIEFEPNNETTVQPIKVLYGKEMSLPNNPTKYGYDFDGWYTDETLSTKFDENQLITENYKLYAKWNITLFMEVENYLSDQNFNGSFLLHIDAEDIVSKGYGYSDKATQSMNSPETIFHIGSVTKQFTAAAILILEEQGLLSVDDPVSKYINGIPNGDNITIHHLLIHSSGLSEYTDAINWDDNDYLSLNKNPETLIDLINNEPILFSPNEEFQYCNTNYLLLGYIIEIVSGESYGGFLQQNIFTPLNMASTEVYTMNFDSRYAVGYRILNENTVSESEKFHPSISYAAGAIASTTLDLYKWHNALKEGTLLSVASTNKMFQSYIAAGYGGYGYGWVIIDDGENPIMEHAGFINGFRCYMYRNLLTNTTMIILTNVEINNIYIIADDLLEIISEE